MQIDRRRARVPHTHAFRIIAIVRFYIKIETIISMLKHRANAYFQVCSTCNIIHFRFKQLQVKAQIYLNLNGK